MNAKEIKDQQVIKLQELCLKKGVDFESMKALLESVKTKKLHKRNNYHLNKISDEIENSIR